MISPLVFRGSSILHGVSTHSVFPVIVTISNRYGSHAHIYMNHDSPRSSIILFTLSIHPHGTWKRTSRSATARSPPLAGSSSFTASTAAPRTPHAQWRPVRSRSATPLRQTGVATSKDELLEITMELENVRLI